MPLSSAPVAEHVDTIMRHRRTVVLVCLLVTAGLGTGAATADWGLEISEFEVDAPEAEASEEIAANFTTDERELTQVVIRGDGVLEKESLLETMQLQRELRTNETVNATLAGEASTIGIGNVVAAGTDPRIWLFAAPEIDDEIRVLDGRSQEQIDRVIRIQLDGAVEPPGDFPSASTLFPADYDGGEEGDLPSAEARLLLIVHDADAGEESILEAQRAAETLLDEHVESTDAFLFGQQLAFERGGDATTESFALIGPIALLLVIGVLALAYREPFEVAFTLVGVGLVLLWTAGALALSGISFTQLLVAVPCLLVGLGVDYALHVVMRRREAAAAGLDFETATTLGLAGVLVAIGTTTVTTALGFLSGLASPVELLRQFGLISAFGIVSAFVVFGVFLPALRLVLRDIRTKSWLGRFSLREPDYGPGLRDRIDSSPGERTGSRPDTEIDSHTEESVGAGDRPTDGNGRRSVGSLRPVRRTVGLGAVGAVAVPVLVVVLAFALALGGAYGATQVDTTTDRADFLPTERHGWMALAPEAIRPAEYGVRERAVYLEETFDRPLPPSADVLIEGQVMEPTVLTDIDDAERRLDRGDVAVVPPDASVDTPLSVLRDVAAENETVAAAYDRADTTGDGVPDTNLASLFDAAFAAAPGEMSRVVHRFAGEYRSFRITVELDRTAADEEISLEMRSVAERLGDDTDVEATATGEPVLSAVSASAIRTTVTGTFLLALVTIGILLTGAYRHRYRSWSLGPVTMVPVVFALAWLFGTMYLLGIPYNAETAIIAGIAIGIGVDYAIHVTERFLEGIDDGVSVDTALSTAVEQTGGTLLASAATTALGFGALMGTIVPSLQRFGFITATVILYSFIACVFVLPSLLVLWERHR